MTAWYKPMTLRRFLLLPLFLFSLAIAPSESVTNQVEQVLSVFASSEFSRKEVLDRAVFSRTTLHEETTYIVTDKASRKYTLVFISKAGGGATSPQGKKVDVISKEIALCDYKTGEVLLSVNNPCPLQKGVDVSEYGSFAVQEFIGKVKADSRVSLRIPLNVNQKFFSGRAEFDGNIPDGDYFAWAIWKTSGSLRIEICCMEKNLPDNIIWCGDENGPMRQYFDKMTFKPDPKYYVAIIKVTIQNHAITHMYADDAGWFKYDRYWSKKIDGSDYGCLLSQR